MPKEISRREQSQAPTRSGDPARGVLGLRDTINSLFEDFFTGRPMLGPSVLGAFAGPPQWLPMVDIKETPSELVVYAAVPGIHKGDVDVQVSDGALVISGECKCEEREAGKKESENWLRSEIPSGKFYRAFSLPAEVDAGKVKATSAEGILEVHLPKAEAAKPRKVQID